MKEKGYNIKKIKEGDENCFRDFFFSLYPKLFNVACRFVNDETARDLVQEVFEDYWEEKSRINANDINSFLFKCIQNKCLNYIKHETIVKDYAQRVRVAEARMAFLNETTDANEIFNHIDREELIARIEKAISKLPSKSQEIFRMSYLMDMDRKDIAEQKDISVRTVEWHIQESLKVLRVELKDSFIIFLLFKSMF